MFSFVGCRAHPQSLLSLASAKNAVKMPDEWVVARFDVVAASLPRQMAA
jgi:hypothetical protein